MTPWCPVSAHQHNDPSAPRRAGKQASNAPWARTGLQAMVWWHFVDVDLPSCPTSLILLSSQLRKLNFSLDLETGNEIINAIYLYMHTVSLQINSVEAWDLLLEQFEFNLRKIEYKDRSACTKSFNCYLFPASPLPISATQMWYRLVARTTRIRALFASVHSECVQSARCTELSKQLVSRLSLHVFYHQDCKVGQRNNLREEIPTCVW